MNVFLGPASQKESLRYDPQANIIYISWEFDNQMYLAKAQDKIKLLDEQLENLSIVDVKSSSKASFVPEESYKNGWGEEEYIAGRAFRDNNGA